MRMLRTIRFHLGYWTRVESLPEWCERLLEEREYPVRDERFTSQNKRYRATLVNGETQYFVKQR